MRVRLLTVANKLSPWINTGFLTYQKRVTSPYTLELVEIAPEKRHKNANIDAILTNESLRILKLINPKHCLITLDVKGKLWSTEDLAKTLTFLKSKGQGIDFIIGGADGVSKEIIEKSDYIWSLSPLTFPHGLVRILFAEQLYRAISMIENHPYHRK